MITPCACSDEILPIWSSQSETAQQESDFAKARLHLHRPEKPNGTGVLVVPGGGYGQVCIRTEGTDILPYLLPHGITVGILEYRLPAERTSVPGRDAQRALRILRQRAPELGVDAQKIGVWGFSAGGHLAATLTNLAEAGDPKNADPIERQSARPDFALLFYPVISMQDGITHAGSRQRLLGKSPAPEDVTAYSMETRVTADHPPLFLLHAANDRAVPLENSLSYALAVQRAGVDVALHTYTQGGHGPGAFRKNPEWQAAWITWMRRNALIPPASPE